MAFDWFSHHIFDRTHGNFLCSLCKKGQLKQKQKIKSMNMTETILTDIWQMTSNAFLFWYNSTASPFVPIQSWSCSSLNVSRTLPPDLLYIPAKGTVGKRSYVTNKQDITRCSLAAQQGALSQGSLPAASLAQTQKTTMGGNALSPSIWPYALTDRIIGGILQVASGWRGNTRSACE